MCAAHALSEAGAYMSVYLQGEKVRDVYTYIMYLCAGAAVYLRPAARKGRRERIHN